MKVFLIDDEHVVNFITRRMIGQLASHVEIVEFTDSSKALDALKVDYPDLVFLDLHMPKVSGWEFLDLMSSLGLGHRVVILSSSVSSADLEHSKTYPNVVEFIEKPISRDDLKRCIQLYLGGE